MMWERFGHIAVTLVVVVIVGLIGLACYDDGEHGRTQQTNACSGVTR